MLETPFNENLILSRVGCDESVCPAPISVHRKPGGRGVYRCPASGGNAALLSKDVDGVSPQESFDGAAEGMAQDYMELYEQILRRQTSKSKAVVALNSKAT